MTDLEISKALALAIGWKEYELLKNPRGDQLGALFGTHDGISRYAVFDYRDWNVIGPIAARYDAFPQFCDTGCGEWWVAGCGRNGVNAGQGADTPQKAIALAVIQGAKK